jgi:phosphatidylinositol alpha-1,6-mannosyltransferase
MRILLITEWFFPHNGGTETLFYNLIKNSPVDQYAVFTPFMDTCRDFDKKEDFYILRSMVWKNFIGNKNMFVRFYSLIWLFLKGGWLIFTRKIDCILFGSLHLYMGLWGYLVKIFFRRPCLAFVFGEEIEMTFHDKRTLARILSQFIKLALKNFDRHIAGSNNSANKLIAWGVSPEKIIINFPCVDLNKFRPGLDYSVVIRRHRIENKRIILTVSRLEKRKGIDLIIKALPAILKHVPDAIYLIVGSGAQQGLLEQLAADMHLSDKVIFVGDVVISEDVTGLAQYYNSCDIFILANHVLKECNETEGFGIVFLEASACGKPVIGGKSGGVADAILDNVTGLLINPEKTEQIVDSVVRLLKDNNFAEILGKNGRARVEKEFCWARYVDTFRKEALTLVSGSR